MNADGKSLGLRAMACKHWWWMPGMRWKAGDDCGRLDDYQPEYMAHPVNAVPDLEDPATLGCLVALVRKAWEDEDLSADRVGRAHDKLPDIWQVYVFLPSGVKDVLSGRSEAEAIVAALEAAP